MPTDVKLGLAQTRTASTALACAVAVLLLTRPGSAAVCGAAAQAAPAKPAAVTGAEALIGAGRFAEAEVHLAALTAREPANGTAWLQLGLARHAQNEYAPAVAAFERARPLSPPTASLENNLGVALFELHELARARAAFERAAGIEPANPRAHLFLARIADFEGDAAKADREFALATHADAKPPEPLAFLHFGLHLARDQRFEDARRAFERALVLDPGLGAAHLNLALALRRLGKTEEANAHAARFRELTEPVIADARLRMRLVDWVRAANMEIEAGHLDAAFGLLVRARTEAPDVVQIHQLLARIYKLQGRDEESRRAEELAKRLLESGGRR
jgi:tetratricopeptide (TPR) repeat protein